MNRWLDDVLNGREDNYMLPFYWQRGDHYEKIPEQIERIYQSGCRALCAESRPHKDFCGETWWRDMDLIISECEKRGMKVWVLDDDHYPTGHAVGSIKDHPELRKWQLIEFHVDVMGPCRNSSVIAHGENEDMILLDVFAYKRTGKDENCAPEAIRLTDSVKDGFVRFSFPEGCYRIFFIYKARAGSSRPDYIDMLNEKSVRLLIDAVYEPHYEHYKKYFGNTFAGFFSDEPLLGNCYFTAHAEDHGGYDTRVGMPGLALPWNDRITGMMRETLGFDPLPYFPALWYDLGEMTGEVRCAYMDAVTKLYRDCFTRQVGDWCEKRGVTYIGHVIEDMNAHARLGSGVGHYFRALDGQRMSGIDIVLHQIIPGMADYIHTASAFANRSDPSFYDYVLAKLASSYSHIGTDMKNRAMCEVYGAYGWAEGAPCLKWLLDFLLVRGVNHFIPHAFSPSFPDNDCPPHFGAEGLDPQFDGFCRLMPYGNRVAHLLYHGKQVTRAAILYHAEAEWYCEYGGAMLTQVPAKMLYDEHIDFDVLPADCFTDGNGCRVFPAQVEDGEIRVGEQSYGCLIVPYSTGLPANVKKALEKLEKSGANVIRMKKSTDKTELINRVLSVINRDIEVKGGYPLLRCAHYTYDGSDVYMFSNESVTGGVETKVKAALPYKAEKALMLDLLNDSIYTVSVNDGEFDISLTPYQSVIAVFDADENAFDGYGPKKKTYTCDAGISFDIDIAEYTEPDLYKPLIKNAKNGEMPDIGAGFSGRIRYEAKFVKPDGVVGIDLGEVGQTVRLYCNGSDMGVRVCPPYSYDLSGVLREGENSIAAVVSNTLANAVKDRFSTYLSIPASGITGTVKWIKEIK